MDAADREQGDGHGLHVELSLLPLKKRALNRTYSTGLGRNSAGDPYVPSKKKRIGHEDDCVNPETKEMAGTLEALVPRQRRTVPAAASREPAAELPLPPAAAAASPPEPAAKGNALSESDEEKKKRLSKGKWLASDQGSRSSLQVTPPPPVTKLMHDGIRSFVPQHRRHAAAAADVPLPLHGAAPTPALGAALERRLAELGATRPWLVHSKTLHKSDVDENQNRLLVSCKRGGSGTGGCPITRCFSPAELERVNSKHAGLWVTALDRGGDAYALTCKFLESNSGYRFITEWKDFLARNGMNLNSQRHKLWTRDVEVELWAFRSRRLPFQPQIDADGKVVTVDEVDEHGKNVPVVQRVSHHLDPDGALGLLLLHHENRRGRVVKSEEEEDDGDGDWKGPSSPPRSVSRKKGKQQSGKRRAASASPVALPAPVTEQGGARRSEEPTFYAAVGLVKLRQSILNRWQEHVDRGNGAKGFSISNDGAKSQAEVEGGKTDDKEDKKSSIKESWGK